MTVRLPADVEAARQRKQAQGRKLEKKCSLHLFYWLRATGEDLCEDFCADVSEVLCEDRLKIRTKIQMKI